jgi:sirohydrochlorin ferrochelatase
MKTAIVLIAHGSRVEKANADLLHLAEQLRADGWPVVEAYLELAQPDIETAGGACVTQGAKRVVLLPYFLSAGVHVRRDLTTARDSLAHRYPQVEFVLGEPLGRHPLLVHILRERLLEALRPEMPGAAPPPEDA